MSGIQWEIKGPAFNNCNCDYGCPCQFNALPTHGDCHAVGAMIIERGHFADTDLSGLKWAITFSWPGAVHMGQGSCQAFIDESANDAQRQALGTILSGQEQAEGASVFSVFASTMETVHEPLFVPIEVEIDIENRSARVHVPELVDSAGEPIRNATTGEARDVSMNSPDGFEFKHANFGSGTSKTQSAIALDFENSHAHWCTYHFNQDGIVGS